MEKTKVYFSVHQASKLCSQLLYDENTIFSEFFKASIWSPNLKIYYQNHFKIKFKAKEKLITFSFEPTTFNILDQCNDHYDQSFASKSGYVIMYASAIYVDLRSWPVEGRPRMKENEATS